MATKVDLPGVGSNVQEHVITTISFGEWLCRLRGYAVNSPSPELRDDVPYETLDCLADPEVAAKHLELQCVMRRFASSRAY